MIEQPHKPKKSRPLRPGLTVLGPLLLACLILPAPTPRAATPATPDLPEAELKLLERMAREGTNIASLYALADVCHDAAVDGDKAAVGRAEGYLRQALTLQPTHGPTLALLGSVYTMKGRDAFWPPTQLKLVREGIEYMDRAVSLAPDDVRTRVTRAFNNAHMPDFLGRNDTVTADLQWLWPKAEARHEVLTESERQETGLHWGRRLKRQDRIPEARQVWQTALSWNPQSRIGRKISEELSKLR